MDQDHLVIQQLKNELSKYEILASSTVSESAILELKKEIKILEKENK